MNTSLEKVVAIDGPSGSGKSTLAKKLAKNLNLTYVDTGAMFRGIGLSLFEEEIAFEDTSKIEAFLKKIQFSYAKSPDILIEINGKDLSQKIREHYVSDLASKVSVIKIVRDYLLDFQRKLGKEKVCVMEGRDIGSVVFPFAFCKFFLTASSAVRAKRRLDELSLKAERDLSYEKILKDVEERDQRDSSRSHAPLSQVKDSIFLDSSEMTVEEVLSFLERRVKERALEYKISLKS